MKPAPIPLPPHLAPCVTADVAARIVGVGSAALLAEPLLGFIASRQCPGHILIETLERVPQWVKSGRVLVSGFHSPLEQQVLRSLLRRQGRAVRVLARGIATYRPSPEEREALAQGNLLVLTAHPPATGTSRTRTTRATSLARNRLVLQLASEVCSPYIAPDSPLGTLLAEQANVRLMPSRNPQSSAP